MPKLLSSEPSLFAKSVLDHIIKKYDPKAAESVIAKDSAFDEAPAKNPAAVALGKLGGSKRDQSYGCQSLAAQT